MLFSVEQLQNVHIKAGGDRRIFEIVQLLIGEGNLTCTLQKRKDGEQITWVELSGLKKDDNYEFICDSVIYTPINGKITMSNLRKDEILGELKRHHLRIATVYIKVVY
ncbi:Maph118 [Matsumuraeses phaseoli granulovirus]|uniref:Maph118 n=1 Tax=Matsumuraeses phaseoli granulovirus TaxID=2760664 RepID=A0AAE7MLH9_9BBAC|nr:Maph118 [Matsumuraeses phaseoli granulovirus]QOD40081.1 Maph118 [Matsumuraeses phaseoli granulovirus]